MQSFLTYSFMPNTFVPLRIVFLVSVTFYFTRQPSTSSRRKPGSRSLDEFAFEALDPGFRRDDGVKGRDDGVKGRDDGVKGRDDGVKGRDDEVKGWGDEKKGRENVRRLSWPHL